FLTFLQTRLHGGGKIGGDHGRDLPCDGERSETLALQGEGAKRETADQHASNEEQRVRLRVRKRKFDRKQNYERDPEKQAVVPGKTDCAIKCARSDVHTNRSDHADCVKTSQRGKVSSEQKNKGGKANRNEQRILR